MLRDAKTNSIAEKMRRPLLGGDAVPAAKGDGGPTLFFFICEAGSNDIRRRPGF